MGSPQIFVRFIALKSESEIGKGAATAIIWTLIADSGAVLVGMVGRALLAGPDMAAVDMGSGFEGVLPALVEHVMPAFLVGLYIAIVLSAIMSTVDSLLVLAGSAAVRDVYQKILHPELPDDALMKMSRMATVGLALIGFAIAMTVAITTPDRTVFWFVIFGWSGISATFCPTIILSLFWRGMTGRGAIASMVAGFCAVPFFKFVGPGLPGIGDALATLSELPPSFLFAFLVGVVVSKTDKAGREALTGIDAELEAASR